MDEEALAPSANKTVPNFDRMSGTGKLPSDTVPNKIVMIDLNISKGTNGTGPLTISMGPMIAVRAIAQGEKVDDAVKDVVTNPKMNTPHKAYANSDLNSPKPTAMSFREKDMAYLIYRLPEGDSLRFTIDYRAFTRDENLDEKIFTHPRRMTNSGEILQDELSPTGQNGTKHYPAGIRHGLFLYDGRNHTSEDGSEDFTARFNLHLDVVDGPIDDITVPYIPIVIDPDVRFPGGNGP